MTFETEEYGRYEIKSGPISGMFGANAFRNKFLIAKATDATRDQAISKVKQELDALDAIDLSERDEEGAPSADKYEKAFLKLLPKMPESYKAMLSAHLRAPDYLISAAQLAEAAGYSGYEGANLHYGTLGQMIAEEIGFSPPTRENGTKIWTSTIARDPSSDLEFPHTSMIDSLMRSMNIAHFQWQLRPQVVQALKTLRF